MPPEAVEGIPDVHLTTLTIGERPDLAVSCLSSQHQNQCQLPALKPFKATFNKSFNPLPTVKLVDVVTPSMLRLSNFGLNP